MSMKKIILFSITLILTLVTNAQKEKGHWMIELGVTPFVASGDNSTELEGGF